MACLNSRQILNNGSINYVSALFIFPPFKRTLQFLDRIPSMLNELFIPAKGPSSMYQGMFRFPM